jgi:hypothetical protein
MGSFGEASGDEEPGVFSCGSGEQVNGIPKQNAGARRNPGTRNSKRGSACESTPSNPRKKHSRMRAHDGGRHTYGFHGGMCR